MGEYALHNGREVKIGTCENMYGLTAEQAPLVTKVPNSLDPIRYAEAIRFRFPFPDEDGRRPGMTEGDWNRHEPIPGFPVDTETRHYGRCSGEGNLTAVVQQKVVDGLLALVCACSECQAAYRLETLDDAAETIAALYDAALAETDPDRATFYALMAERAVDGYLNPPAWVAERATAATTAA